MTKSKLEDFLPKGKYIHKWQNNIETGWNYIELKVRLDSYSGNHKTMANLLKDEGLKINHIKSKEMESEYAGPILCNNSSYRITIKAMPNSFMRMLNRLSYSMSNDDKTYVPKGESINLFIAGGGQVKPSEEMKSLLKAIRTYIEQNTSNQQEEIEKT